MKQAALILVVAVLGAVGLDALADLTQDRPDRRPAATSTDVVLQVSTRGARTSPAVAAEGLWAGCQGTTRSRLVEAVQPLGGGRYRLVLAPPLGEHARRRLHGCLEDALIERVLGRVERMTLVTVP